MNKIFNRYWLGLSAGAVATICLLFFFSSQIDPYHFFGRGSIELKPAIQENLRFHKTYQVQSIQPSVALFGSSRVYHGLDPDSSAFADGKVVYNMGVPACRISEIAALIEHVNNISKVDEIIIGLDIFAFDVVRTAVNGMPWESLYRDRYEPSISTYLLDVLKSSAAIKSVVDSIRTIFGKEGKWNFYHENGFLVQDYFDKKVANVGGYYQTMAYFIDGGILDSKGKFSDYILSGAITAGPFSVLSNIIKYSQDNQIKLKLFISPVHAVQLEYMEAVGFKNVYNTWRKKLVDVVEDVAGYDGDVSLWDFSGYNHVTTEAIPEKNDKDAKMIFFLDASHFKKISGDLILEKISGRTVEGDEVYNGFGRVITSKNFIEHLEHEKMSRIEFFRRDPGQYQIYRSMLAAMNIAIGDLNSHE